MEQYTLARVGLVRNHEQDIVELYGYVNELGVYTVFVNHGEFGLQEVVGFEGTEMEIVTSKEELENMKDGLCSGIRGKHDGIIKTRTGYAFLDDLDTFEISLVKQGDTELIPFECYNEVGECDIYDYKFWEILAEIFYEGGVLPQEGVSVL